MRARRGFTILETLASLALLAVILQISYVVLSGTLDAEEVIQQRFQWQQVADGIRDVISTDLANIMVPEPKEDGEPGDPPLAAVALTRDDTGVSALSFAVLRDPVAFSSTGRSYASQVTYRMQRESAAASLLRTSRVEEVIASDLRRVDLQVYQDGQWQPWMVDAQDAVLPSALRLVVVFGDGTLAWRIILLSGSMP